MQIYQTIFPQSTIAYADEEKKDIDKKLEQNIIRPSNSPTN